MPSLAAKEETLIDLHTTINERIAAYRESVLRLVSSYDNLPQPGTENTLYLVPKSTDPARVGEFVLYVYNEDKYTQVGSSIFPTDYPIDEDFDATSRNPLHNSFLYTALGNKRDKNAVNDAVLDNDNLVTSNATALETDKKAEWPSTARIKDNQVYAIIRDDPDYATMIQDVEIQLDPVNTSAWNSFSKLTANSEVFNNLFFGNLASGSSTTIGPPDRIRSNTSLSTCGMYFREPLSKDSVRADISGYIYRVNTDWSMYPSLNVFSWFSPASNQSLLTFYTYYGSSSSTCASILRLNINIVDPIPLYTLKHMILNVKPNSDIKLTVSYRYVNTDQVIVVHDKTLCSPSDAGIKIYTD